MEPGKSYKQRRLLLGDRGLRLLPHQREQPAHLTALALDHRGEFGALRHHHADPLDDDVVYLEGALVGDEPPIDLERGAVARVDDVGRYDDPVLVASTAAHLEHLTADIGEAGAVHIDDIILEQL